MAHRLLLVLALSAALIGCGRQDRYEITGPADSDFARLQDWAEISRFYVPNISGDAPRAMAGRSVDDYLMALWWGEIYRVQGDHYQRLEWPGRDTVAGIVIRADGSTWAVDYAGQVCTLQGTHWQPEIDLLQDGSGFQGLLEDDQGRLVAFGQQGLIMREDDGGWVSLLTDPVNHFSDAWAAPGQGTFLVTTNREVFQLQEEGAALLVRLGQNYGNSYVRIEGDGNGRLGVSDPSDRVMWVLEGDHWNLIDDSQPIMDLFWIDGQLHGLLNYPKHILRRDQGQWQVAAELPDSFSTNDVRSCDLSGGRLIGLGSAGVLNFQTGQLDVVSQPLGDVVGLLDHQGSTHVLLSQGAHLLADADGWQMLGRPLEGNSSFGPASLSQDASGRLMILGSDRIVTWDEGIYQIFPNEGYDWSEAYPQPDGSVFLAQGNWGDFSRFQDGVFTPYLRRQNDWESFRGVVLQDDGQGWVVDDHRLGSMDEGLIQTQLVTQGWFIRGLAADPVRGAVAFGSGRVLVAGTQGIVDITPTFQSGDEPQQASITNLLADPWGGLVAWDDEQDFLLQYDGLEWIFQPLEGVYSWWNSARMSANPDGTLYLWDNQGQVFRIEPEVGP